MAINFDKINHHTNLKERSNKKMKNSILSYVDYGLLAVGVTWGLENVESALGILILIIQLVWLLCKLGVKLYNYFKGIITEDETAKSIEEITKELEELRKQAEYEEPYDEE